MPRPARPRAGAPRAAAAPPLPVAADPRVDHALTALGYGNYKWCAPRDIVVAEWVRQKCRFGCGSYGRAACCPPNTPPVEECRRFFAEYEKGVVLHFARRFADPNERHAWSRAVNQELLEAEKAVFFLGFQKTFLFFMDSCTLCESCVPQREACRQPRASRPSPEAYGVDVFSTVRALGFPIQVLTDTSQETHRYAILLVD